MEYPMFFRDESHIKEINRLKKQVADLQLAMHKLTQELHFEAGLKKSHILRLKNGDSISDDYIINKRSYVDLTPEAAYKIYNNLDQDFVLLDVSANSYEPIKEFPEALKIPLDDLAQNLHRLPGKSKHYMIISENGVKSIKACKFLNLHGFFYLSNISGGYSYWPEFKNLKEFVSRGDAA